MRWIVSCTKETRTVSEKLFQGAVAPNYFTVSDDDRTTIHMLNTALAEAPVQTFSENILLCVGPHAFRILGTPHCPVRSILSAFFSRNKTAGSVSFSSFDHRMATLSISSFNGRSLNEGGTPLALRVAQGLGIVSDNDFENQRQNYCVKSALSTLSFGNRESSGHVVRVNSATDADAVVKGLLKSPSFQRHLLTMSLCVRIAFAVHSDAASDGDDFPHWVNEQVVSFWFLNDRHTDEFIHAFDNSLQNRTPAQIIVGFANINSNDSAVSCVNTAAHVWRVATQNDQFRPISVAGRHIHHGGVTGNYSLNSLNQSTLGQPSLSKTSLKASHDYFFDQIERMLDETAAYLKFGSGNGNNGGKRTKSELAESRSELEDLVQKYRNLEKRFNEYANHLERERERFRVVEDEAKTIADSIEQCQKSHKEEEVNRKALMEKIVELTKTRDELHSQAKNLKNTHDVLLRQRSIDVAHHQAVMIKEAVKRQEELDAQKSRLQKEEEGEFSKARERLEELRRELELIEVNQENYETFGNVKTRVEEKSTDLAHKKSMQQRLKKDVLEKQEQHAKTRSQMLGVTAEYNEITRRFSSVEHFQQNLAQKREELTLETKKCSDLRYHIQRNHSRKNEILTNHAQLEISLRSEIDELRISQEEYAESMKAMMDENITLLEQQESFARNRIESTVAAKLCTLEVEFWQKYNQAATILRLRSAEKVREGIVSQVNSAKNEITQLSYQSIELDDDIDKLTFELEKVKGERNSENEKLQNDLREARRERERLLEAVTGGGTQTFPLLNAQRELLEQRFETLQQCEALPSLPTPKDIPAEVLLSYSPTLPTRQVIEDELVNLCLRLNDCMSESKIDNSNTAAIIESLSEKETHLNSEITTIKGVLVKLQDADNELTLAIAQLKNEIRDLLAFSNITSLQQHDKSVDATHFHPNISDQDYSAIKTDLTCALTEAQSKVEDLEKRRSENLRQMKLNQSRLDVFKAKMSDVRVVQKEIDRLASLRLELSSALRNPEPSE